MSRVPFWFERRFEFSFPAELLPNLLARLRGTPARLEEALRGYDAAILTRQEEASWSAQEHAGHLADMEPLWSSRVQDFMSGSDELTVADLTNRETNEAKHNSRPANEIVAAFRAGRARLLCRVGETDAACFTRTIPHPRLKTPMHLADHLHLVAEHDDHHLPRIWELVTGEATR